MLILILIYIIGFCISLTILYPRYYKDEKHLAIIASIFWPMLLMAGLMN